VLTRSVTPRYNVDDNNFFSTRGKDNLTDRNEERLPNYAALYTKRWKTNKREKKKPVAVLMRDSFF